MRKDVQTKGGNDLCKHRVQSNLFYEPSTRTSSSFQAAMLRLGGGVRPFGSLPCLLATLLACARWHRSAFFGDPSSPHHKISFHRGLAVCYQVVSITDVANSSVSKGETLGDTIRCLQCYSDLI